MALDENEISNISPLDIDDSLTLTASQLSSLDSGHWSSGSTASCQSEGEESSSMSSDNEASSEASYRVKRSLHSAKGLCAFLVELVDVIDYVITRYCEEFKCDA